MPCPNRFEDNSCTIDDYYDWYFGPLLQSFGTPQNLSGLRINLGSGEVNFPGIVTKEYLESVYYYGVVMSNLSDIGLNFMPGGNYGYTLFNSTVGKNPFTGYVYSPSERYLNAAFLSVGGVFEINGLTCKPILSGTADEAF